LYVPLRECLSTLIVEGRDSELADQAVILGRIRSLIRERISADSGPSQPSDNQWAVSATEDECQGATPEDVASAYEEVAVAWTRELKTAAPHKPATFYLWFDEQASQLRCSAIQSTADRLPFRCQIRNLPSPVDIARAYLQSSYKEGIPFSDLKPVRPVAPAEPEMPFVLDVWSFTA